METTIPSQPQNGLDIFAIRNNVVEQFRQYVARFLAIADDEIRRFVETQLFDERRLWPDALLQLNPAYEKTATVSAWLRQIEG